MAGRTPPPGSQTSLREANRARLLESLRLHGHLTQVELAGVTGLSPATVSNIVRELTTAGVLHTSTTARSGRRAIEVRLARQTGLVAAVHVSHRHMRVAIADVAGTVLGEHNVPLPPDHRHDQQLDRVALMFSDMVEPLDAELDDLLAVGVAIPVPVQRGSGMVATPGLLRGWEGVAIAEGLSARIGRPVLADSEANLAALAEARHGAGRGARSFAFVRAGHTISAGLVVGGELFHGASGKAGQIGHVTIDENGPICRCGNRGCLDTLAGGPALLDHFHGDGGIHRLADLLRRAESGDAGARRVIADAGRHIGIATASLCNLFDPELIVVGGELGEAGELLTGPMRHALDRSALAGLDGMPELVAGSLGARAELVGCLDLAIASLPIESRVAATAVAG